MTSLTPISKKLKSLFLAGILGPISPPPGIAKYPDGPAGLFKFISNSLKLFAAIAGIYAIFQIIIAGYGFISANGDAKKVEEAWNKIWQSALGLLIIASTFAIAGLISRFVGYDIANPQIYGPQ